MHRALRLHGGYPLFRDPVETNKEYMHGAAHLGGRCAIDSTPLLPGLHNFRTMLRVTVHWSKEKTQ